ncbi:MAG: tRNA (adenosine(37)-N6)-threonylcarbamoyltransferase complex ATPase subunit type 1 TsaE [Planctomycetota bacterium]|jgi:tRNA threonylcarbamoyladenosine biosynthesis protein TsaE
MAREVVTRSAEETRALGREVGARLAAGDVILLDGELGSGKTTFVKGIAEACGVRATVRSPTFALMHRYRGEPDLVHVDLYREREAVGLEDLDLDPLAEGVIVAVEWPRGLSAYLWPDAPRVRLEHVNETSRRITLPSE